ncbi:MAG: hypothetical protein WC500_02830 [Candidatus Margulisiibacteriota bacterium]
MAIVYPTIMNVRSFHRVLERATCKQTLTNFQQRVLFNPVFGNKQVPITGQIAPAKELFDPNKIAISAEVKGAVVRLYCEMEGKKLTLPETSPEREKRREKVRNWLDQLRSIQNALARPMTETELLTINDQLEKIIESNPCQPEVERLVGVLALEVGRRLA